MLLWTICFNYRTNSLSKVPFAVQSNRGKVLLTVIQGIEKAALNSLVIRWVKHYLRIYSWRVLATGVNRGQPIEINWYSSVKGIIEFFLLAYMGRLHEPAKFSLGVVLGIYQLEIRQKEEENISLVLILHFKKQV